jgi:hypothetical protein
MTERHFLTYRGVALPLQLTEELQSADLANRNTWFTATYDDAGRMLRCEKRVYGSTELLHEYGYDAAGRLCEAVITVGDEEPQRMTFPPRA